MTYEEFKKKEKYIYYSPLFDELILGSIKEHRLYLYIANITKIELEYIGEL